MIHCGVVPQHGQEVDDDEAKARKRDLGTFAQIRLERRLWNLLRALTAFGLDRSAHTVLQWLGRTAILTPWT